MAIRYFILSTTLVNVFLFCGCSIEKTAVISLAEGLRFELRNREFGKVYDEASEFVYNNVSRADFIQRTGALVDAVEAVDPSFSWKEDESLERSFKVQQLESSSTYSAYRKVGSGDHAIQIFMYWEVKDGKARIFDLVALTKTNSFETVGKVTGVK